LFLPLIPKNTKKIILSQNHDNNEEIFKFYKKRNFIFCLKYFLRQFLAKYHFSCISTPKNLNYIFCQKIQNSCRILKNSLRNYSFSARLILEFILLLNKKINYMKKDCFQVSNKCIHKHILKNELLCRVCCFGL
jgi:hypothetical protein